MGCVSSTQKEHYNTDFSQISSIHTEVTEKKEETIKFPAAYRVVIDPGANCRVNISRTSAIIFQLRIGTTVTVEEIVPYIIGERARISSPHKGWISLRSSVTDKSILEPATEENDFSKRQAQLKQWMYSIKFTDRKTLDCTKNEKYVQALYGRGIWDVQQISELTDEKLKNMGIENAKDRGKILAAKQWKQKNEEQEQKQDEIHEPIQIETDSENDDRMEEYDDIVPKLLFHVYGPATCQPSTTFSKDELLKEYKKRIINIYALYNRQKMSKVDGWLEKYKDNPHELYIKICNTYKLEPKPKITCDINATEQKETEEKIELFENCIAQTIETDLGLESTVNELHYMIKRYFGMPIDVKLLILYAHSVLSDDTDFYLTLRDCGITNHSFFVVAIHNEVGKTEEKEDTFLDFEEHKRLIWSRSMQRGISLDVITRESRADVYRMPFCNHSMSKDSLYYYVLSEYKAKKEMVKCPHTKNKNTKVLCEQSWDYPTIKKYLLSIPEDEKVEDDCKQDDFVKFGKLEVLASKNVMENHFNLQKCGHCNTLYYREKSEKDNCIKLDVECILCKNKFCWGCSDEWKQNHFCDNSGIRNETINILMKCNTKTIGSVSGVPELRACPNCYQLITHTEACKHMKCVGCKKDFCFVCLKMKNSAGEWECGSYDSRCPVHPRQKDSLPRLQNETTFHLF